MQFSERQRYALSMFLEVEVCTNSALLAEKRSINEQTGWIFSSIDSHLDGLQ